MVNPVGIGLSVGGSVVKGLANRRAAKKRDKVLAQILQRQGMLQNEIDARLAQEIGTMRAATPETERAAAMGEFVSQLRAARASRPESYGARGQVSDREVADLGVLENQLGIVSNREADITARLDSQRRMREKEALRHGRVSTDVRGIGRKMSAEEFLGQLRLAKVRPNKWLSLAGDIMGGAGKAMSMGGFGGGGGAAAGSRGLMQLPGGFDPGAIYGD